MFTKPALFLDVDMTLLPSMATDIAPERARLIKDLHEKLNGALALVTGRPAVSVDAVFSSLLPASVEHHSAWRACQGEAYKSFVMPLNTQLMRQEAARQLEGHIAIFDDKSDVLSKKAGVFLEEKIHTFAMVFSASLAEGQHKAITEAAHYLLRAFDLMQTHKVVFGSDAVEITSQGQDKSGSVRDFMATDNFKGRQPIFIGDSASDIAAMKTCYEEFGGYGIFVGNQISAAHISRCLPNIDHVWDDLARLLSRL